MRVDELTADAQTTVRLRVPHVDRSRFSPADEVRVVPRDTGGLEFVLIHRGEAFEATPADGSSDSTASRVLTDPDSTVIYVAGSVEDGSGLVLTLDLRHFPQHAHWGGAVDIGVDDQVMRDIARHIRADARDSAAVLAWLEEEFLLGADADPSDGQAPRLSRAVLLTAAAEGRPDAGFRMVGRSSAADIVRAGSKLLLNRFVRRSRAGIERRALVEAGWRFRDATLASTFTEDAKPLLDRVVASSDSYLSLWRTYNDLAWGSVVRDARDLGFVTYSSRASLPDGTWRFRVSGAQVDEWLADVSELADVEIEASEEPPLELTMPVDDLALNAESRTLGAAFIGELLPTRAGDRTVDLRPADDDDREPPEQGVLHLAFGGDRKRLERRERAWRSIATGTSAIRHIGLLIEGQPAPVARVGRKHKPMSPSARQRFAGEPTPVQLEAISIALNTPDIALIQGPPGTGKTQVIAALEARLAEIEEDAALVGRNTLLTSFQHDAVEHALSRTEVFGLPAVKVGQRRRGGPVGRDQIDRWRRERAEALREELEQRQESVLRSALRSVRSQSQAYLVRPTAEAETLAMLRELERITRLHLRTSAAAVLDDAVADLERALAALAAHDPADNRVLVAVRGIRVTAQAFADDGPVRASQARLRLESLGLLSANDLATLSDAAACLPAEPPPELLANLQELRDRFLDELTAHDGQASPVVNRHVVNALRVVEADLQAQLEESSGGVDAVLEEFLDVLEHDPEEVERAVRSYTTVLAATCQQAASRAMADWKDGSIRFTNVVVDEAARANPLDLMIPLAAADRRVVLVGDHRQLPHILEPDIERELERSMQQETQDALRRSLFERLFRSLGELQAKDGIPRVITLDTQYRMHPILGEFVSRTFYGSADAIRAGRQPEEFVHGLSRFGDGVGAWIGVPLDQGAERGGRSKSRRCEAHRIAAEVEAVLTDRPDLSVGVITFYSAQVTELWRALAERGLAEESDSGYRVAPGYAELYDSTGHYVDRLRVGTVDAFQGMEFDVVFLSIVRSNRLGSETLADLRRKYGHLLLENRLCVAMSRQRRLLVAVGDASMFEAADGPHPVPGLASFRALCEGEHGSLVH